MFPDSLVLTNYRSFAAPTRLELRPITLLFGVNNSGKSALLRALPLVADSLSEQARFPLNVSSPALQGATFRNLRWRRPEPDDEQMLGLSLGWKAGPHLREARYFIHAFDQWRRLVVDRFELIDKHNQSFLSLRWNPIPEERSDPSLTYVRSATGEAYGRVRFDGLLPTASPDHPGIAALRQQLVQGQGAVQWLQAVRRSPGRTPSIARIQTWRMEPNGEDVAEILGGNQEILQEVSDWYRVHVRRTLHLEDANQIDFNEVRLVLRPTRDVNLDIDLADSGEGIIQALPILTALAAAKRWQHGGPSILAVEEPESHLNPKLQRALAEQIATVACGDAPPSLVFETHSPHLLMAIQLLVADRDNPLPPDRVIIYWVWQDDRGQSFAERITLDENARFEGPWPRDAFSDLSVMARMLLDARRGKPL